MIWLCSGVQHDRHLLQVQDQRGERTHPLQRRQERGASPPQSLGFRVVTSTVVLTSSFISNSKLHYWTL